MFSEDDIDDLTGEGREGWVTENKRVARQPRIRRTRLAKRWCIPDTVEACLVDLGFVEACRARYQPRRTKEVVPSRLRLASLKEYKLSGGTMSTVGVEGVNQGQMPKSGDQLQTSLISSQAAKTIIIKTKD